MSHIDAGPLSTYNSLMDKHLAGYFSNSRMRRHLKKSGLITRRGEIVSQNQYRLNMAKKEHKQHVKDLLAQAIVHKTLDMERMRQVAIKKKLEEIAKIELVKRVKEHRSMTSPRDIRPCLSRQDINKTLRGVLGIRRMKSHSTQTELSFCLGDGDKSDRRRQGDEDILPYLSPRPTSATTRPKSSPARGRRTPRDPYQRPGAPLGFQEHPDWDDVEDEEESTPNHPVYIDAEGRPVSPPGQGVDKYPKDEIDTRHLYALDNVALREYSLTLEESQQGKNVSSPYTQSQLPDDRKIPSPPRTARSASSANNRRRLRPIKQRGASSATLHRQEPPMSHPSRLQSLCEVQIKYHGENLHLTYEVLGDPRHEVLVEQQHCGGNTLIVYKDKLMPGNTFKFLSRRHRGYPFSLTFYVNGVMDARLSTCCEYKHTPGCRVGGKQGHFGVVGVSGGLGPCYKCQVDKQVKKSEKKKKPKQKKDEIKEEDEEDKEADAYENDFEEEERTAADAAPSSVTDGPTVEVKDDDEGQSEKPAESPHSARSSVSSSLSSSEEEEEKDYGTDFEESDSEQKSDAGSATGAPGEKPKKSASSADDVSNPGNESVKDEIKSGDEKVPKVDSDVDDEVSEKTPNVSSEAEAEEVSENETEKTPNVNSEAEAEEVSEKTPNVSSEAEAEEVSENETEKTPNVNSEAEAEEVSEKTPNVSSEAEAEEVSENETEKTPNVNSEAEAEEVSENETEKTPSPREVPDDVAEALDQIAESETEDKKVDKKDYEDDFDDDEDDDDNTDEEKDDDATGGASGGGSAGREEPDVDDTNDKSPREDEGGKKNDSRGSKAANEEEEKVASPVESDIEDKGSDKMTVAADVHASVDEETPTAKSEDEASSPPASTPTTPKGKSPRSTPPTSPHTSGPGSPRESVTSPRENVKSPRESIGSPRVTSPAEEVASPRDSVTSPRELTPSSPRESTASTPRDTPVSPQKETPATTEESDAGTRDSDWADTTSQSEGEDTDYSSGSETDPAPEPAPESSVSDYMAKQKSTPTLEPAVEHDGSVKAIIESKPHLDLSSIRLNKGQVVELSEDIESRKDIESVVVRNGKLDDDSIRKLSDSIIHTPSEVKMLNLNLNRITPDGAKHVAAILKERPKIKVLLLHGNPLGDAGIKEIVSAVEHVKQSASPKPMSPISAASSVSSLDADKNPEIGSAAKDLVKGVMDDVMRSPFLQELDQPTTFDLQQLDLGDTGMGDAGCEHVARIIALDTPLATLSLTGNMDIKTKGWESLADALRSNTKLRSLSLDYTNLHDEGVEIIVEGLLENVGLQSLDLEGNFITENGGEKILELVRENHTIRDIMLMPGNEISQDLEKRIKQILEKRKS